MDETVTGAADFGGWLMGIGDKVLTAAIDAKVNYPHQEEQLRITRLGQLGYYTEGQRAVGLAGIHPAVLLVGGAVLVYLLVKG